MVQTLKKPKTNIYFLVSLIVMFISILLPIPEGIYFIFGILLFFNFGWTILQLIEHFKK
jgi:hypothetical protein